MPRILVLDTSSEACSAALWLDGQSLTRFEATPRQHTKLLLPMVEQLLSEAELTLGQLDAIAFGRGPGSFTGLRISTGVAQGLAFGADLPLLPVSTLAALAGAVLRESDGDGVIAALDARMSEIYWGCYQRAGDDVLLVGDEHVGAPESLVPPSTAELSPSWLGSGSGWQFQAQMPAALLEQVTVIDTDRQPDAAAMAPLAALALARGEGLAPEAAQPTYLRDNVAHKKGEQR